MKTGTDQDRSHLEPIPGEDPLLGCKVARSDITAMLVSPIGATLLGATNRLGADHDPIDETVEDVRKVKAVPPSSLSKSPSGPRKVASSDLKDLNELLKRALLTEEFLPRARTAMIDPIAGVATQPPPGCWVRLSPARSSASAFGVSGAVSTLLAPRWRGAFSQLSEEWIVGGLFRRIFDLMNSPLVPDRPSSPFSETDFLLPRRPFSCAVDVVAIAISW